MEQRNTQYPVYIPDQYLTNKSLNDTTEYLEKEERATRSYTIGNGVINRLTISEITKVSSTIKGIKILTGYGLTPDGFLLETEKKNTIVNLSFATNEGSFHYIKTSGKNIIINGENAAKQVQAGTIQASDLNPIQFLELFETQPDSTIDTRNIYTDISIAASKISGFNTNDCVLALLADINDTKYDKCAQGDCNDRGSDRIIKCRYILIPSAALNLEYANKAFIAESYLELPRLNNISGISNMNDFNYKVLATFKASVTAITNKLKSIIQSGHGILYSDFDADDVINRLEKLTTITSTNIYALSFANDMQQAINEYVAAYNVYAAKYPLYTNSRIDRLIVLGTMKNTATVDANRYYYQPIQGDTQYDYENQILLKHYNRILGMVLCYAHIDKQDAAWAKNIFPGGNNNAAAKNIKLIPSKGPHNLIGNKAIPYYYNTKTLNEALPQLWNAHAPDANTQLVYNYYKSPFNNTTDIKFNIHAYNFFRIEGHIGVTLDAGSAAIANLITNNDLCIRLLSVNLSKVQAQSLTAVYAEFKTTFNALVKSLRKEDTNSKLFVTLYQIQKDIAAQNIRDTDGIQAILNRLSAYLNEMLSYGKRSSGDPKKNTIKQNILPFRNANETTEQKIINIIKSSGITAAKTAVQDAIKNNTDKDLLTIGNIIGTEYLAGVYKGGTFILLHDGQKIIGDCSLPYFYGHK
jgi:hypothetical protein